MEEKSYFQIIKTLEPHHDGMADDSVLIDNIKTLEEAMQAFDDSIENEKLTIHHDKSYHQYEYFYKENDIILTLEKIKVDDEGEFLESEILAMKKLNDFYFKKDQEEENDTEEE